MKPASGFRLQTDGEVTDAGLGVDALCKVQGIYASRQRPPARSSVDKVRNGSRAGLIELSSAIEIERKFRAVQPHLLNLKVELHTKFAAAECLAGGSL